MGREPFTKITKKRTLADSVAEQIRHRILAGEILPDELLATESDLVEQFGVSRAVIRDACRILMAQGLIEIRHGVGIFVTPDQHKAFEEALLLALERANASVWDVQQFEQAMMPVVVGLAAVHASKKELRAIKMLIDKYLGDAEQLLLEWGSKMPSREPVTQLKASYHDIMHSIYAATHNRVLEQLARPILNLHSMRDVEYGPDAPIETALREERRFFEKLYAALTCGDSAKAQVLVRELWQLPEAAVKAMKVAPIGQMPAIRLDKS